MGKADEVAQEVENNPAHFEIVFRSLFDDELEVWMMSADVIEKVTKNKPEIIICLYIKGISILVTVGQQEVC